MECKLPLDSGRQQQVKKGIYPKRIRFSSGLNPDALAAQLAQSLHPKDWIARYPCKIGNKELSLKAKGLLSQMLSLPEDWVYTLKGLSIIIR